MKLNTVFGAAFWLMMMATVGTGVVNANEDQNPSQAGESSIYFYDVAASDSHGKGKLQIDLVKHTFVFNGQDFEPAAQIVLRARAAGSAEYVIIAIGKATPSGNLHMAGTWEAGAAAEEVVAGTFYYPVYGFGITNWGWFVCQLACYYSTDGGVTWHESAHVNGIAKFESVQSDLGALGVPYNALVKIHIEVVGGKDRTGSEVYQYFYTDYWEGRHWVYYNIFGATWNPDLEWDEVDPPWN